MSRYQPAERLRDYELVDRLGSGGVGEVFMARQDILQRTVAIKIVKEKFANDPDFVRRFEVEAQIVANLEHPYIVPLYDYWREPGGAFLVMRWIRGGSLRQLMSGQPLSPSAVASILQQLCAALQHAHAAQVVHRDIKPENILIDRQGNAYISDFGIAIRYRADEADATRANIHYGSPAYISPEQITRQLVSPQADVYALGVMVYELLVGHLPYSGQTTTEIIDFQINEPMPSLREMDAVLPGGLDVVIQRATAKDPRNRYLNLMDMAGEFNYWVERATGRPVGMAQHIVADELTGLSDVEAGDVAVDDGSSGTVPLQTGRISEETGVLPQDNAYETGVLPQDNAYETGVIQRDDDAVSSTIALSNTAASYPTEPLTARDASRQLRNPYRGLAAFHEADAANFSGREADVEHLLGILRGNRPYRCLTLIGASGSGKSSIIRAGVVPALRRGVLAGSEKWYITTMIPGANPYTQLGEALLRVAVHSADDYEEILRSDETGLVRMAEALLPDDATVVIVIDQFEEIFTLMESEAERRQLLQALRHAATSADARIHLILTLRADLYDRPLDYPEIADMIRQTTHVLLPPGMEELEAAITNPALRSGLSLEPDLSRTIAADVLQQPNALPLLQYTMQVMFEMRDGLTMTRRAYDAVGGVAGA
ncbi:MAG: serine/threonine-protein kinase [Chloroflexota bacterium]